MAHLSVTFLTDALRRPIHIDAVLPTDKMAVKGFYFPEKKPMKTLYLLEGLMSLDSGTISYTNLQGMAEDNNCAVFIIGGENEWYGNATFGWANYNDMVWNDLVKFTRASFNLSDKREDTFIGGFSMGGGGALVIGLSHPEIFSKIVSFSPSPCEGDSTNPGVTFKDRFHIEGIDTYEELAKHCAQRTDTQMPDVLLTTGTNDVLHDWDFGYYNTLKELGYNVDYIEHEGLFHSWANYQKGLEDAFAWLPLDRFDKAVACMGPEASVEKIFVGWTPYYNADSSEIDRPDVNDQVNHEMNLD